MIEEGVCPSRPSLVPATGPAAYRIARMANCENKVAASDRELGRRPS